MKDIANEYGDLDGEDGFVLDESVIGRFEKFVRSL